MARTGENQANQANTINQDEKVQSYNKGQTAIGQATSNIAQLAKTGSVGVNPWMSSGYLSNENKLQADALDNSASSAKSSLARANLSTGGLNGSETALATRDIGLQNARLADQLSAERAATDFNSNVAYQQSLATMPLSIAGAESPYFGTSTSGQDSSLNNLTQFGLASYGPYLSAIQAAGAAGSAAAAGPSKACWIAEALYGEKDWRTLLLRSWLNQEFKAHWYGKIVMRLYVRFGQRIAEQVRKRAWFAGLVRPLFELGLRTAVAERNLNLAKLRLEGF